MKKSNILFILPQTQQGGAEVQLLNLLKNISRSKYKLFLGLLYKNKQLKSEFNKLKDIKIVHFSKKSKFDIGVYFRIADFIKRYNIDITQTFLGNHHSYIPAFLAGKSFPIGGIRSTSMKNTSFFNSLGLMIQKKLAKSNNYLLISNSHSGKKNYVTRGFPDNAIRFIANGIDYNKFSKGNKQRVVKEFGFKNKLVLGIVSRIQKRKNHELLIRIFNKHKAKLINVVLLIVGDGLYLPNLKKLVKNFQLEDKIIFTGSRKDISDLLSTFDIFVFPSLFPEAWPNVIGEAMSAGLPVISYSIGDVPYIIKNNYDGVVTENNIVSFEDQLFSLIRNKKKRYSLAKNAKKTIKDNYDLKKMTTSYEKIYDKIGEKN